jgi:hypothetical protein
MSDNNSEKALDREQQIEDKTKVNLSDNVNARYVPVALVLYISSLTFFCVRKRIQNPLHGIPKDTLMRQVEEFTREKGLEDKTDIFKKGALIAQSPKLFESMEELDEQDKEWIRREVTRMSSLVAVPVQLEFLTAKSIFAFTVGSRPPIL